MLIVAAIPSEQQNMTIILDAYKAVSDKISTFFVEGEQHVFLTVADFYDNATSTTGALLGDYINEWLVANSSLDASSASGSAAADAGSVTGSSSGSSAASTLPVAVGSLALAVAAALAL